MSIFKNIEITKNDTSINGLKYEADICPKAWEHYKIVYKDRLKNYNFELSFYTALLIGFI